MMGCCVSTYSIDPHDLGDSTRDEPEPPWKRDPPAETQKAKDPSARNRPVSYRSRSVSIVNEHDIQPKFNKEVPGKRGSSDHSPQNSVSSGPPDQAPPRRPRTRIGTRDPPDQRLRSQPEGHDQVSAETQKVDYLLARNRTVSYRSRSGSIVNEHDIQPKFNKEVPGKWGSSDHSPQNSVWSGPPDQAPRPPRSQSGGHDRASWSPASKAPRNSTWLDLAEPGDLRDYPSLVITQRPLDTASRLDGLSELQDRLLSADGKPSVKIEALDCTNRLSERTEIKGIGAYSDVSQAKLDNRLVAVKALRVTNIEGIDEARMKKRLGREISVWAALRHPNVLEFLGFAFEGGRPCLISPWCERGTLSSYLERERNADRGSLVCQIAEGLNYLHLQSPPVVHGDLKTANVLITEDHIAKICDFGVSKHLGEGRTGFTTDGIVATTIRYSAPETLQEGGIHTLQSDVYSFACVALETMTSKCPFWKILKPAAIITKVAILRETPSPGDYPDLNDDRLWELLRRCWSYEPSDRPKMSAVCSELAIE